MTTSIDTVRRFRPVERAVLPARAQVEPIGWPSDAAPREGRGRIAGAVSRARGWRGGATARSCSRPRAAARPGEWFWLASVAMISCGFVIMVGLFGVGGEAPEAGRTAVVRVQAGDTLWGIANRVDPDADPRALVQRIVELNGLGAPSVEAGSRLVVPADS